MMKKILTFLCLVASTSIFAQTYSVEVETYVKGKVEDKFTFDMDLGSSQTKGFDGKYLAKRYRANGYMHKTIEEAKAKALLEEQLANSEQQKPAQIISGYLDIAEKKLRQAERSISAIEGDQITLNEEVQYLTNLLEKSKGNTSAFKPLYAEFEERYEISKEDNNKKRKAPRKIRQTGDVEEIDIGSYCTIEILKEAKGYVQVNLDYAYSRLEGCFYSDGNNNMNSITKFPIIERFEKLGITELPIQEGKPYCFQFSRKSPKEMQSLSEALASTGVFGGGSSSSKSQKSADSEYDTQGSYADIKKNFGSAASKVVRVVITVKKAK